MSTVFDNIVAAFDTKLSAATAVCTHIETDEDALPLPEGRTESVLIWMTDSEPQPLGELHGNPVDWLSVVVVRCIASLGGASARSAANVIAGKVYARLAATPDLGLGDAVFIGEPRIRWATDKAATRLAEAVLTYTVRHRTSGLTVE